MPNFSLDDHIFLRAAELFPTPFYLYDERGIRQAARSLQKAFSWNPRYREYFAVKALPNPSILAVMRSMGFGFDCSSVPELLLARQIFKELFASKDFCALLKAEKLASVPQPLAELAPRAGVTR